MKLRIISFVFLMIFYMGQTSAQNAMSENRSQGADGGALVAELCTKCHNLDEVVRLRQSRDAWEDTVYSMVGRGAPIFPDEIDVIIDYLSQVYGPEATR